MADCPRERVYEFLQSEMREGRVWDDPKLGDSAILMNFVVIAEWQAENGYRYRTDVSGDARGIQSPIWTVKGLLNDLLDDLACRDMGDDDD